jgi:hypothetical protein
MISKPNLFFINNKLKFLPVKLYISIVISIDKIFINHNNFIIYKFIYE